MSSLFNFQELDFEQTGSRVFSTARYLDSPLIADHLLSDIELACTNSRVEPSVYHLRSIIDKAIRECKRTDPTDAWKKLRENWTKEAAFTNGHIVPLAPSDILRINDTLHYPEPSAKVAEAAFYEIQSACNLILLDRGITSLDNVALSRSTKNLFSLEDTAIAPQSDLVALRASGETSLVHRSFTSKLSDAIILSDAYVAFIQYDAGKIIIGTYNMYLSLLDIVRSRARTSLGIDIMYPNSKLAERVRSQWKWQEEWIYRYETEGFALAKQTEALNKTRLGWLTDVDTRVGGAYEYMWSKVLDKVQKLEKTGRKARKIVADARSTYEQYVSNANESELVELFGLQKTVGYPFIDSVRSGRAAAKEAKLFIDIEYEHALRLRNAWRSMFVAGYLAKEHKWPSMDFSTTGLNTALYKWHSMNYTNLRAEDFELEEWNHVIFDKTFEFDYHENYLELMDDKALSYSREEADAYWNKSLASKSDRRLLLEIMSRDGFSFRAILEDIETDDLPHNWKIVCIYPKEKELKPDARMFAMLVLEMRTFFNGCEANLASTIFPYISSQTMTKSKEDIHRIFHEFTKPRETDTDLHLFLECDLSRWNLRWRKRVVNLVGADLNHLFGVQNAFTTAHEFFTSSIIVVRTPRLRPEGIETHEPPAGPLIYRDWLGGLEGLQQKLWTLCTYAMIFVALRSLHISYILIGQGDNQILSIVAPRDPYRSNLDQYRDLSERVTALLEKHCAEVGQELKPDECLHSRTVITYSKEVWVLGVMYPLSLKYFSRIGARTNDEVPTLCAELSGLHAAALAAAESNLYPLSVYFGCVFLHVREIESRVRERHPCWSNLSAARQKRLQILSLDDHMKILFWPSACGGLSISTLVDYIHRGPADPLSQQLGLFFRACRNLTSIAPLYTHYMSENWLEKPRDAIGLIMVPHSLPLVPISDARSQISKMIRTYIQTVATNPDFQRLMGSEQTIETEVLLDDLMSMYPMYPLLAREIFDNSASAEVERIGKMYIMTQTIQKAARAAGVSVSGIINMASGDEFAERVCPLLEYQSSAPCLTLPLKHFENENIRLRRRWEVITAPVKGISSRASIWSDIVVSSTPTTISGVKAFGVVSKSTVLGLGPNPPYLGARTRLERSEHGYRLIGDGRATSAISRLRTIANLPGMSKEMQQFIRRVAETRGPINGELTDLAGGVSSSRFDHRYHSRVDEQGSYPVGPYNFSTHVSFDTDCIEGISGSTKDYPIKFQEYHTDALGCLALCAANVESHATFWEVTLLLTNADVEELPDLAVSLQETQLLNTSINPISSALVYDPDVWRVELTGTVARKHCSSSISPDLLTSEQLIEFALRARLSRHIPTHFTSTEVFDAVLHTARPVVLDLAEIQRLRGVRILDVSARVISFAIFERFMVETQIGEGTGRIELYIRRYAAFYASALQSLWENPQTWNDSVAQTLNLNATQLIGGTPFSSVVRLRHLLLTRIRRYIYATSDQTMFSYIFESEPGSTGSRTLLGYLGSLHFMALRSGVPWTVIKISCSMPLIPRILNTVDEGTRLRLIQKYARTASKQAFWSDIARTTLTTIANGDMLNIITMDDKVALRLARKLVLPPTREAICQSYSTDIVEMLPWSDTRRTYLPNDVVRYLTKLSARVGWALHLPLIDGSYSFLSWRLVFRRWSKRNLLLVGVGHGYAARAFFDEGGRTVSGIDKPLAYTLTSLRANRKPFAIRNHERRSSFSWNSAMYLYNPEKDLHKALFAGLSSMPNESIMAFDIQPGLTIPEVAQNLSTQSSGIPVVLRFFGSRVTIFESLRTASRHLPIHDTLIFGCADSVVLFVLTCTTTRSSSIFPYWSYTECYRRPDRIVLESCSSISDAQLQDTYDAIQLALDVDIRSKQHSRDMLTSLRNLIGKTTLSDKYTDWTTCLARIYLLQWYVEDNLDPTMIFALEDDVLRAIRTNTSITIPIARSSVLVKMMTTTGAALLFLRHLKKI